MFFVAASKNNKGKGELMEAPVVASARWAAFAAQQEHSPQGQCCQIRSTSACR